MADLLPSSSDVSEPEASEPRVVGVDSDAADDLLAALSSRTARRVLIELHEDPSTPARLAERVDTSLQNVQYHLDNLDDADLVEVADTVYSEKGREMKVFAPADRALVVVAGREEETTGLKATLKRLLGSVGALGVASLLVDRLLSPGGIGFGLSTGGGGADGAPSGDGAGESADPNYSTGAGAGNRSTEAETTPAGDAGAGTGTETAGTTVAEPTATRAPTETGADAATSVGEATATTTRAVTETAASEPTTVVDALTGSPGLLFFLGGLTALLLAVLLLRR